MYFISVQKNCALYDFVLYFTHISSSGIIEVQVMKDCVQLIIPINC